jgi:hypothetical protein
MNVRRLRRVDYLVATSVRSAIRDVVINGVVKEHCVLRHDADRRTQALLRHVANVDTVYGDAALLHIVETKQQAGKRRLSGAAVTNHCDGLSGRDFKADIIKNSAARIVGKHRMFEAHRRVATVQYGSARPILDFEFLGNQRKHSIHVD